MSPIVQTVEGEKKNDTQYNSEIAKSSFSICYSYSCEVKSLTIYQNHCPTGRGVLNSFQVRYWALFPHRAGNSLSGPLASASLRRLRNFQPNINFRGLVDMIKTQSCFVFHSASYLKPLRSVQCWGQARKWIEGREISDKCLTAVSIAQEQDTSIKSYSTCSLPIQ